MAFYNEYFVNDDEWTLFDTDPGCTATVTSETYKLTIIPGQDAIFSRYSYSVVTSEDWIVTVDLVDWHTNNVNDVVRGALSVRDDIYRNQATVRYYSTVAAPNRVETVIEVDNVVVVAINDAVGHQPEKLRVQKSGTTVYTWEYYNGSWTLLRSHDCGDFVYENTSVVLYSNSTNINGGYVVFDNLIYSLTTDPTLEVTPDFGQIELEWTDVTAVEWWDIYFSQTPGVTESTGQIIPNVTGLSYTHTGLEEGHTYYYIVIGRNDVESTSPSPEDSATVYIRISFEVYPDLRRVYIRWDEITTADSYNLYWAKRSDLWSAFDTGFSSDFDSWDEGGPWTKIENVTNPYIHTDLDLDEVYCYYVTYVSGGVEGPVQNHKYAEIPFESGYKEMLLALLPPGKAMGR